MALELASKKAPPTPWATRIAINHRAPSAPVIHVTESMTEKRVNTAKPRLYIFTRPYISPRRPKLTTSTVVTSK
jgi:hypothetical protein